MTDDRRIHPRFKSTTILQYKESFWMPTTETMTKDLSLSGVCFFSQRKLSPGQAVRVKMFYDPKSPEKVMKGRIVWSKPYEDSAGKGYINGLVFVK